MLSRFLIVPLFLALSLPVTAYAQDTRVSQPMTVDDIKIMLQTQQPGDVQRTIQIKDESQEESQKDFQNGPNMDTTTACPTPPVKTETDSGVPLSTPEVNAPVVPAGGEPPVAKPPVAKKDEVHPEFSKNTLLVINVPSRTLFVYYKGQIKNTFPVGVGRPGFPTPAGQYKVIRKVINPGWENPYEKSGTAIKIAPGTVENPLGTRWIGFLQDPHGEYGMHGTDRPSSVGHYSSHGCVRMLVKDSEKLFDMIDVGTPISVSYDPLIVKQSQQGITVTRYADVFKKGTPTLAQLKTKILHQYPNAQLDDAKLASVFKLPLEKSVVVGTMIDPSPIASQESDKPAGN